eukprot:1945051-Rhodomonas_salina.3
MSGCPFITGMIMMSGLPLSWGWGRRRQERGSGSGRSGRGRRCDACGGMRCRLTSSWPHVTARTRPHVPADG